MVLLTWCSFIFLCTLLNARWHRVLLLIFLICMSVSYFFIFMFILERWTEHEWGRGRERGRHRIWSRLQVPSCQHRAWCGAWTHELWDHDLSRSWMPNPVSHSGAPKGVSFYILLWSRVWGTERGEEGWANNIHCLQSSLILKTALHNKRELISCLLYHVLFWIAKPRTKHIIQG